MPSHSKAVYECQRCSKEYIRKDHYEKHLPVCNGENAGQIDGVDIGDWANSILCMLPSTSRTHQEKCSSDEEFTDEGKGLLTIFCEKCMYTSKC